MVLPWTKFTRLWIFGDPILKVIDNPRPTFRTRVFGFVFGLLEERGIH